MKKRILGLFLSLTMILSIVPNTKVEAATTYISVENYVAKVCKTIGIGKGNYDTYVDVAIANNLVTPTQFSDTSKDISRQQAAVIANKAYEYKYGTKISTTKVDNAIAYNTISDIDEITADLDNVIECYVRGIDVGYSNGEYTISRQFRPGKKLRNEDANTICERLADNSKCRKINIYGQLIRTTNLPSNYKEFDYILEEFPNSFYEKSFYYTGDEGAIYLSPAEFNAGFGLANENESFALENDMIYSWASTVANNIKYRLNINYENIGSEWINNLAGTYDLGMTKDTDFYNLLINYVEEVINDKTVVELHQVSVDPGTTYVHNYTYYVRAYCKFTVRSSSDPANCIIFSDTGATLNETVECVMDIPITAAGLGSDGYSGYTVMFGTGRDYIMNR